MSGAEQRGLPYLFKLRLTANVKKLIEKTFSKSGWTGAGQGWQGRRDAAAGGLEPPTPGGHPAPPPEGGT